MFSQTETSNSMTPCWISLRKLLKAIDESEAVLVGAGARLSAAAGLTYSGPRFEHNFADFIERYGLSDMYSAGFYPFASPREFWAYWSRHIYLNRYCDLPKDTYQKLLTLVGEKNYFVITTNVDHAFQKAGFAKERLFYCQGDYGLWQCSRPCHERTYDNERQVKEMVATQRNMLIPETLLPTCPRCGAPMTNNLRSDLTFVEDEGWFKAYDRYKTFLDRCQKGPVLYLELGVGQNTPSIIKHPFWRHTKANPQALYICLNLAPHCPEEMRDRSLLLSGDTHETLNRLIHLKNDR